MGNKVNQFKTLGAVTVDKDAEVVVVPFENQLLKSDACAETDDVRFRIVINNGVKTVAFVPDDDVVSFLAPQLVVALAADQDVVAFVAVNDVVSVAAINDVVMIGAVARAGFVGLRKRQSAFCQVDVGAVGKFQRIVDPLISVIIVDQPHALGAVAVDINVQIVAVLPENEVVKTYVFAEADDVAAEFVVQFVKPVAFVPDVNVVAGGSAERFVAVKNVVAFAADDDVAAVVGVDGVAAAVAVNDVVKVCSVDLFGRVFLGERQSAFGQVETAAIGKFQFFYHVFVFLAAEKISDFHALCVVSVNGDQKISVFTGKRQIVKGNAFAETDGIAAGIFPYLVQSVASVPDVNVVAFAAVQSIIPPAADNGVVSVSCIHVIVAAAGMDNVVKPAGRDFFLFVRLPQFKPFVRKAHFAAVGKFQRFADL